MKRRKKILRSTEASQKTSSSLTFITIDLQLIYYPLKLRDCNVDYTNINGIQTVNRNRYPFDLVCKWKRIRQKKWAKNYGLRYQWVQWSIFFRSFRQEITRCFFIIISLGDSNVLFVDFSNAFNLKSPSCWADTRPHVYIFELRVHYSIRIDNNHL